MNENPTFHEKRHPMVNDPILTIVSVFWNACEEVEAVIASIVPQLSERIEYIVIDGGSTDGTVEEIQKFANHITHFVSEPDSGIYDAMNKAHRLSNGRFIIHMNAGDKLLTVPLGQLESASPEIACLSFPVQLSDGTIFQPSFDFRLNYKNTLHHQGTFYNRTALVPYDTAYPKFSDYDFNLKLKARMAKVVFGDEVVAFHASGGASEAVDSHIEFRDIIKSHGGHLWFYVSHLYSFFFRLRRKLRKNLRPRRLKHSNIYLHQ